MANVIPLAGLGSRFSKEGYTLPKPLIPVSGRPMIVRAIQGMPTSDRWVFLVREEHVAAHHIDGVITDAVPGATVIPLGRTTEGQACTCLLGVERLDPDEEVFIAACDNSAVYDMDAFDALRADPAVDCIVFTFTREEQLRRTPRAYGWARLAPDGRTITGMSVKQPVSDDPYHDHAVVATFWFRRARDYADALALMMREDYRINNEFYVDALPIFLARLGKRAVIFDVDLYVCWGTPDDLRDYEAIERALHAGTPLPRAEDEERRSLWAGFVQQLYESDRADGAR